MANITDQFIDNIIRTSQSSLSEKTETEARRCLLDFIGAAAGGASLLGDKIKAYLDLQPACEGSTVINTGCRASLQNAALSNGMMAHVFDIDDGNRLTSIHLGAPIIAAVLSAAEYKGLTLGDVLKGAAVGYEAANRLGRCIQPYHRKRGFHASGTCGEIGAAMGCAAAMRFDREMMKNALSAACTAAAGILQMQEDASQLKPFNIGRAAHDGVTSALIAQAGFAGPEDPLCGKFGLLPAMAEVYDTERLTGEIEESLTILGSYHKIHASCRHTHAAVDAAREIMKETLRAPEDVASVTIRMYDQGVKGHDHTEVGSPVSGKMSVPFAVALAIVKGSVGFSDFTEENIFDKEVQRICRASTVISDEALTAQAPKIREQVVTIAFTDGTEMTRSVKFAKGEPEYPLTEEDIRAKAADLALCGGWDVKKTAAVSDFVLQADLSEPIETLFSLIRA